MKVNQKLEKENEIFNSKLKSLDRDLQLEVIKRDDLEQYGRRTCIEISGIPTLKSENTLNIVQSVANALNLASIMDEVDVIHRISKKEDAPIIVKFKTRSARDSFFFSAKKTLKDAES